MRALLPPSSVSCESASSLPQDRDRQTQSLGGGNSTPTICCRSVAICALVGLTRSVAAARTSGSTSLMITSLASLLMIVASPPFSAAASEPRSEGAVSRIRTALVIACMASSPTSPNDSSDVFCAAPWIRNQSHSSSAFRSNFEMARLPRLTCRTVRASMFRKKTLEPASISSCTTATWQACPARCNGVHRCDPPRRSRSNTASPAKADWSRANWIPLSCPRRAAR
mmetsp:Transcript_12970/g.31248  ORF Transcript_12970/g.31248 Transcript_12970/m.31248 type:complete len:226 (+) Transcript_12970:1261-1938(+)